MARIAGVDIPKQKRGVIALTYIFGIGNSRAKEILKNAGVDENKKVNEWSDDEIGWESLQQNQQSIAQQLTQLGDGLVLPGDPDWVEPQTGMDDFSAVSYRQSS